MQYILSKLLETIGNHVNLIQSIIKRDWFSWHISTINYLVFVLLYIIIAYDCYLDFNINYIYSFVYNSEYWCIFIRAHVMYILQMNMLDVILRKDHVSNGKMMANCD